MPAAEGAPPATLFNYRDLGGHPVPGGRLRTGLLFRSNALVGLDIEQALALELRTAIDLREPGERTAEPTTSGEATVHHVPIIDRGYAEDVPEHLVPFTLWLAESRGPALARVVTLLAAADLPAVIFCSTGKDRTGVLAGILQSALGVADEAVVAGYAETAERMPPEYFDLALTRARAAGMVADFDRAQLDSPPELMAEVLAGVRRRHIDAAGFLVDHGLPADELERLRQRTLDPE